MRTFWRRLGTAALGSILAALVLVSGRFPAEAGNPLGATYGTDTDRVFWFIHATDPHIGTRGSNDSSRLRWLVTTARSVITPDFIVLSGDLTDSTNGNLFGYPNGPYQAEWDEYKSLLSQAGANDRSFLYDIPGNHDAYSDKYFAYYCANSVQGCASGSPQVSWTRTFPFGTYHFLGVNTADNTGKPFSLTWPYGDYAGLDETELAFIRSELSAKSGANLTFVFGHHPVTDTGASGDTWLYYGHQAFIQELGGAAASAYNYGHTHSAAETLFDGNAYTGAMPGPGVRYTSVASLGKSSSSNFSVIAVDHDAVSTVTQTVNTWPVVLITAPVDAYVGSAANPYAYTVPAAAANPIRALVFDSGSIASVDYRIDGATTWTPMHRVAANGPLWTGTWDATSVVPGEHTIEVRAVGTTTRADTIRVQVTGGAANRPPVAANDSYSTLAGTPLVVSAPGVLANDSDPDGDALVVTPGALPSNGTLTLAADGGFTYAPPAGFSGTDAFTYVASDSKGLSSTATVTVTVTAAPTTDTVRILSATYTAKRKVLSVEATSSAAPNAVLTVVGYGQMTYKTQTKTYTYQATVASQPGTVTVTSNTGGSATANVALK
jgi:hypothetical protein